MKVLRIVLLVGALLPLGAAWANGKEKQVKVDQLPAPVRATIEREAQGHKIEEVEQLSEQPLLFETEIKKDGREVKLYVDGQGKIVGRSTE